MKRRFDLDFIRMIAFFLIIYFHFQVELLSNNISLSKDLLFTGTNCETFGFLGVGLFLLLSGYCLAQSFERSDCILSFYKKRLLSLFPMFYLAYFISYIWFFLPTGHYYDLNMIYTLLGIDGLLSVNGFTTAYTGVGEWYLGVILIYYLLFPVLYKAIKKKPVISFIGICLLFTLFTYIIPFEKAQDASVFSRLLEFSAGIYLAMYYKQKKAVGLISGLVFFLLSVLCPQREIIVIEIIANISCFLFLMEIGNLFSVLLTNRGKLIKGVVNFVSKYSYAMYLTHHIVIIKVLGCIQNATLSLYKYAFLLFLTIVITCILGFMINASVNTFFASLKKTKENRS